MQKNYKKQLSKMDNTKRAYSSFTFEWTVKSISYQIQYRKAENINEIDEIFCSIINAKGNEIAFSELAILLGFNLQDLAETDIFNVYLKDLVEYNLITVDDKIIQLTEFGQDALQNKLKYKYFFATTELLENHTAFGERFDFSFESVFNLENHLSHKGEITKEILDVPEVKQKLQFQLFENDIYNGEIIEIYESQPNISYKTIDLKCETYAIENSFQLSIFKSDIIKPDIQLLIDLPVNRELKSELIRKGMFHHILTEQGSISVENIETYIDLWNWKELAENQNVEWNDQKIFKLFQENGNGSIWRAISQNAPVECIKPVIEEYAEYWNWTTLTERFDDNFIKIQIETFDWDFEVLSYKETELVTSLLTNSKLKDLDWDWNYLSRNLPDEFIEKHIEGFPWDFYEITVAKNDVFKNTFIKYRNNLEILISKSWNWKYISEKIDLNFLYKNITTLSSKLDWHTILNRFFMNEEMTAKCLQAPSFKSLLNQYLPDNFVVAHQKYLWTQDLIDFFEGLNLIQWETKSYIQGFDTNENVEWNKSIFEKYHNRITTKNGFLNVSQHISDFSLLEDFPDFAWDWQGVSQNELMVENPIFIKKAFKGEFSFTNNLNWAETLKSITNLDFINNNLEEFQSATEYESQADFWKQLTIREEKQFVFEHYTFPWDWSYLTENSEAETILDSLDDEALVGKWDWRIATRKLDKETILDNLEGFTRFIDWEFLIAEVFTIENELSINKELPKIAACLSVLGSGTNKDIWKGLTAKFPFEKLFPIVQATYEIDIFEWDWDFISQHKYFPTDIATLNQFKEHINWTTFSESITIQQKFNPKSWNSGKEWFDNTYNYLQEFEDDWDWRVLSKNDNINYNRFFLQRYRSKNWDWDYLTEFGGFLTKQKRDEENYLRQIIQQFPKIKFEILSRRRDIKINSELLLLTWDKNWDWRILSENESAEITNAVILKLQSMDWDWQALSKRKEIDFDNNFIYQLLDQNWDWSSLSLNKNLEFNIEFIQKTRTKPWNWQTVSRHKSFIPTAETLTLTKDFDLDWKYLSKHPSLHPTKEILAKFENKWHWQSITENLQINFDDIDFLERFADKWNWHFICKLGKLALNNQILNKFKEYLEWNLISSNTNIHFTKEIIQEFKQFWNWSSLKENKRVIELLGSYVTDEINKNATLNFIDKIEQQWSEWKGSIYHFSHIDNAVEIIKNRKIQSRNKANLIGDAAGNVVHRRNDAHDYARFYFRPHTPTQFYNEFLGKDINNGYTSEKKLIYHSWQTGPIYRQVSWYDKARNLGFPKCPIPIFFRFSLQEVLFKNENKCCVSNGNMQTRSTQFGSLDRMINKFGFEDLYYTPQEYATKEDYNRYRNYAQQEFLVKNELSFNDINDFEIVCPSDMDRTLLIKLLGEGQKDIFSKIVVDRSYYNNENPRVRIKEEGSELHIKSKFNGKGYFVLNGENVFDIDILAGDVNKIDKDKIIFNSNISLGNLTQSIKLNFIDESDRNWFIYSK